MQCRLWWMAMGGALLACEGSSNDTVAVVRSYVEVLPREFQGSSCQWTGGGNGSLAYYVATLINVAEDDPARVVEGDEFLHDEALVHGSGYRKSPRCHPERSVAKSKDLYC